MTDPKIDLIRKRLQRSFKLTLDLYTSLEEANLSLKISDLPSNTIGQQVWCIVGARESYFKAIQNGDWQGFSCSLKNINSKKDITSLLESTSKEIIEYLTSHSLPIRQSEFLMDLLEHEIQHHGQLIRLIYTNKLAFPKSWNARYTV